MKTVNNKWNGTKITLNYIGNMNNKFGVKKKKIILEEDKLQPLFHVSNNDILSARLQNKNENYFHNPMNMNKRETKKINFKSIHIEDWEKANNYNFYNYFKNFKYFHRINNSKRLLSSNIKNDKLKLNKNNSSVVIFQNEFSKESNKKRKENNFYSTSRGRKKTNFSVVKSAKNKGEKKELSKKNISEIISNFITQRNTEKQIFNHKNKIINDNIKAKSLLLNLDFYNLKLNPINKVKKYNYIINKNDINYDSNNYNISPFDLYSMNDNKETNNIINKKTNLNYIFNSNFSSNSHSHISFSNNRNKKYFTNNINNNNMNNLLNSKNITHSIKKSATFCDVGTNTDF